MDCYNGKQDWLKRMDAFKVEPTMFVSTKKRKSGKDKDKNKLDP